MKLESGLVAKFSLRRFDNQAQASVWLSLLSVAPLGMLAFAILRRLDRAELIFYYGSRGKMLVLLSAMATFMLAAAGFGFGLNSAGQKRNDKQQLSWIGFFTGALVLALTCVLVFVFLRRGEAVVG